MIITQKTFGVLSDGREAALFTLKAGDLCLSVSTFGAAWTSLIVPGKNGRDDVLLGFSSLEGYLQNPPFLGATIGRFANRIKNGAFTLEGKQYQLYRGDGDHCLHGGRRGFDKKPWEAYPYTDSRGVFVRFELESPDGDEGFPGKLLAAVTYGLSYDNEILADYRASVDAPCPVNFTNHAYFNLAGEGNGDILSHELKLHASSYLESGGDLVPTGKLLPVVGTPFDFTAAKPVGRDFAVLCGGDTAALGKGYDHCFVVEGGSGENPEAEPVLRPCAEVREPSSGRGFRLSTSQPGVQFYSGNFLAGIAGKAASVYGKNAGFCLETQHFPDSPNQSGFPPAIFGPGKPYHEQAVFAFSW
ncbi:MAG: galactose mutarotase [Spirochaetaceae bacterium]|jgi:aldose 1-epimerase|nr:galactose mutarotase [Spirochaetaceae bacterium]